MDPHNIHLENQVFIAKLLKLSIGKDFFINA